MADMSDTRTEIERFKTNAKLFSSLDAAGVARLADIARKITYKPNDTVVEQGAAADTFFIIVQGGVRVITDGRDEDKEVARLGIGGFFGEMGILNDEPRSATIRAIGDTSCLVFDKADVLAVFEDYPQILHGLGSIGVERGGKLVDAQEE